MVMITVAIVVMIVPVAICMPAVSVFVPPPVRVRPAELTRLVQLLACVICLSTLPAVAFNSRVQSLIGFYDAPLAGPFISADHRRAD
jgi:hypothetical protein